MTPRQAKRLTWKIRNLADDANFVIQPARMWWPADQEQPLAVLRRDGWRHWWLLSESAVIAEGGWSNIHWDEPARPVYLHYARAAS